LQRCQGIRAGVGRRNAHRSQNISANLIRLWLTQFDHGDLTGGKAKASVIAKYETHIVAPERKEGLSSPN
jgi:hypothetical protein